LHRACHRSLGSSERRARIRARTRRIDAASNTTMTPRRCNSRRTFDNRTCCSTRRSISARSDSHFCQPSSPSGGLVARLLGLVTREVLPALCLCALPPPFALGLSPAVATVVRELAVLVDALAAALALNDRQEAVGRHVALAELAAASCRVGHS